MKLKEKGKSSADYALQWKNHVSEVLYGPIMDIPYQNVGLNNQMRNTITDLCIQIDKVAELLVKEGVFAK